VIVFTRPAFQPGCDSSQILELRDPRHRVDDAREPARPVIQVADRVALARVAGAAELVGLRHQPAQRIERRDPPLHVDELPAVGRANEVHVQADRRAIDLARLLRRLEQPLLARAVAILHVAVRQRAEVAEDR
jgi:hypothetical protein